MIEDYPPVFKDGVELDTRDMTNGTDRIWGTLGVQYKGMFGQFCDNPSFQHREIDVLCRDLGFDTGTKRLSPRASSQLLVEHLQCAGTENSLQECAYQLLYDGSCPYVVDVECTRYPFSSQDQSRNRVLVPVLIPLLVVAFAALIVWRDLRYGRSQRQGERGRSCRFLPLSCCQASTASTPCVAVKMDGADTVMLSKAAPASSSTTTDNKDSIRGLRPTRGAANGPGLHTNSHSTGMHQSDCVRNSETLPSNLPPPPKYNDLFPEKSDQSHGKETHSLPDLLAEDCTSEQFALDTKDKHKIRIGHSPVLKFGDPKTLGGATFVAAAIGVTSNVEVRKAFRMFMMAPRRMTARYNMVYFRLHNPHTGKMTEGCKDDGDHGAGKMIKQKLHSKHLSDIAVFLSESSDGSDVGADTKMVMEEAVNSALEKFGIDI